MADCQVQVKRKRLIFTSRGECMGMLSIFLASMLVISAVTKFFSLHNFAATLKQLDLKYPLVLMFAVPFSELFVSLFILFESTKQLGLVVLLLLSVAFYYVTIKAIRDEKKIACGCFGAVTEETFGLATIMRITIVFSIAMWLLTNSHVSFYANLSVTDRILTGLMSIGVVLVYLLLSLLPSRNVLKKG